MKSIRLIPSVFLAAIVLLLQQRTRGESQPVGGQAAADPSALSAPAQAEALKKYPQLGQAASAFNREFVSRYQRYQKETPQFFSDPMWPMKLADEVAKELGVAGSVDTNENNTNVPTDGDRAAKILAFCQENFGRMVGNGQCSSLVGQALQAAGAGGIIRDFPRSGDYVWGKPVAVIEAGRKGPEVGRSLAEILPGDVIQFRDVQFKGRSHNGGNGTYWTNMQHHSAVVAEIDAGMGILKIFEQNVSRPSKVTESSLYLSDLKTGWMRFYRPLPKAPVKVPTSSAPSANRL